MPWIKATDIAYGRLGAPDLDLMEEFLTRFGLIKVERTANALYMRGTDPAHHIHITEKGDPRFLGVAYYADSEEDLHQLAKAPGASPVETIDEPGGGKRVRLIEPNGYTVEVVHGIFFFSSSRRHTSSLCDWSSDVCSSDLDERGAARPQRLHLGAGQHQAGLVG